MATPTAGRLRLHPQRHAKRYITNGGIADVLTVMAKHPGAGARARQKITAFLVTPDMPGFKVIEARAEKCGIRGTATGKMSVHRHARPGGERAGPGQ